MFLGWKRYHMAWVIKHPSSKCLVASSRWLFVEREASWPNCAILSWSNPPYSCSIQLPICISLLYPTIEPTGSDIPTSVICE